MKSLIVFSSQSGNTKKLAEAVAEELPGIKELVAVENAPDHFDDADLLAVGFWLMGGKPDPKSSEFLSKTAGKKLFLFATHGAARDSAHARAAMEHAMRLAQGAQVVGTFSCQGAVQSAVMEKAAAKNPPPAWFADAPAAVGHPDGADLAALRSAVRACL
ncbi:MAG: flavodoxin family protein [Thermodesulfobacteriota bacterium]